MTFVDILVVFLAGVLVGFFLEVVARRVMWGYLDSHAKNIKREYEKLIRMSKEVKRERAELLAEKTETPKEEW